jgi:DNA-binding protein YbaB
MDNDSMRDDLAEMMALAQDQMRELSAAQQQRMALTGKGTAADGLVEVTVDAQGTVTSTVIQESYLQEFEFAELSDHITTAARAAAQEVQQRGTALFAPLTERRQTISALSGRLVDAPDISELMSHINPAAPAAQDPQHDDDGDADWTDAPRYPTVRK